jgi:hypothetical protein
VQRVFGAIAIFAGWLSIGVGAVWGLISSEFLGLAHKEGDVPPSAVYGVSGAVVLWVFTAAAVVAVVPLAAAMVAVDPRRQLRWSAQGLAIAGVVLLPDELGRFFGLPLLAGAVCLWIGGELIHREALALAASRSGGETPAPAGGTSPGTASDSLPAAADPAASAEASSPAARPDSAVADSAASAAAGSPAALLDSAVSEKATEPGGGRGGRGSRRKSGAGRRVCQWCSTAVPARAVSCPNCKATLDAPAADEMSIPGLTEVPLNLQRYAEKARRPRTSLLSMVLGGEPIPTATDAPPPSDSAAMRPPSPELKAEMARLDAEIAAGASIGAGAGSEAPGEASGEGARPTKVPSPRKPRRPQPNGTVADRAPDRDPRQSRP